MSNPNQGIVHGEVVINGNASAGVDVIFYKTTPAWDVIEGSALGSGTIEQVSPYVLTDGAYFINAMVGKVITFAAHGDAVIINVIAPDEIMLDRSFGPMVDEAFSMPAQEGLQVVTFDEDDILLVTDIFISQEEESVFGVVVGEVAAGRQITGGSLLARGMVNLKYTTPHICCACDGLKYIGHTSELNVCFIKGQVT
ncbi:hypothetical protein LCGC14_1179850 [marine sediment metagenome]|uniref:Uncharacterized protein n=1 Tax=marine sediment metagenome TaxID=412755 RepID=A0A0F9LSD0_9ZZZZ